MEAYLLKSTACLAIFFIFYKLLLEKESIHQLKRYYLLVSLLLSFVIPFVSYTTYEFIAPIELSSNTNIIPVVENIIEEESIDTEMILFIMYGFVSLIFLFFFMKNLFAMTKRIKTNEKNITDTTTKVLLKEQIAPHTFLKYIFINREEYRNNCIPESVLIHEEAHAKQKHSIDILLIEFLQILLWFNPIIYLYKKVIKLNHEFLADEAVLNQGYETKTYQKTLLAYSSHAIPQYSNNFGLANAINYSLIKKRLTIMRTQTTKKATWLRSMLLVPLIALLLFSFSTKEIIYQEKATKEMVVEYNKLAKKYSQKQINKYHYKEVERLNYIYKLMTPSQKENAEPFPNFPPPPPPAPPKASEKKVAPPPPPPYPKDADCYINDKKATMAEVKKIKAKNIQSVFVSGKDKPGKPRLDVFTKEYRGVVAPKKDRTKFLPHPPYPAEANSFINGKKATMAEVKKIDSKNIKTVLVSGKDQSGNILKKPILEVYTNDYKGDIPQASKYTNRPGAKINGKVCEGCMLQMTKEQLKNSVLSLQEKGKSITSFNLKLSKYPTARSTGNILSNEAKKVIDKAEKGQMIQIFNIKVEGLKTKPPILITLLD